MDGSLYPSYKCFRVKLLNIYAKAAAKDNFNNLVCLQDISNSNILCLQLTLLLQAPPLDPKLNALRCWL